MCRKNIFTTITTTYEIELIGEYSDELLNNEDFKEWIQCKACELGSGKQCEHYNIDPNGDWEMDIEIIFYVF